MQIDTTDKVRAAYVFLSHSKKSNIKDFENALGIDIGMNLKTIFEWIKHIFWGKRTEYIFDTNWNSWYTVYSEEEAFKIIKESTDETYEKIKNDENLKDKGNSS